MGKLIKNEALKKVNLEDIVNAKKERILRQKELNKNTTKKGYHSIENMDYNGNIRT